MSLTPVLSARLTTLYRSAVLAAARSLPTDDEAVLAAIAHAESAAAARFAFLTPDAEAGPPGPDVRAEFLGERLGALVAAHVLRLAAGADDDSAAGEILAARARALSSVDPADRFEAGLRLRRELPQTDGWWPWPRLGVWLSGPGVDERAAAGGYLARAVVEHVRQLGPDPDRVLAGGWWSVCGRTVVGDLAHQGDVGPLSTAERTRLVPAVLGCWGTGLWSKVDLAAAAGITRPTLDSWIRQLSPTSGRP